MACVMNDLGHVSRPVLSPSEESSSLESSSGLFSCFGLLVVPSGGRTGLMSWCGEGEMDLRRAKGGVLTGDPNKRLILVRVLLANKTRTGFFEKTAWGGGGTSVSVLSRMESRGARAVRTPVGMIGQLRDLAPTRDVRRARMSGRALVLVARERVASVFGA